MNSRRHRIAGSRSITINVNGPGSTAPLPQCPHQSPHAAKMKSRILAIDVGGTHTKLLATGHRLCADR
jgi:hexokinase